MKKVLIASTRAGAGKTNLIVGLAKNLGTDFGYMKPLGDRLIYRKKRLWDHDSSVITGLFPIEQYPEDISLGFIHSKLMYMYDQETTEERLKEMVKNVSQGKDMVLIEGGRDLKYGISVFLDPVTVARTIDARLVVVVPGDSEEMLDDIFFLKKFYDIEGLDFAGVVINKVPDVQDLKDTFLESFEKWGIPILGVIPNEPDLLTTTVEHLATKLFAKIITGEGSLDKSYKNVFVAAMSTERAQRNPLFSKEKKVIITSGDRSEMILAALESDTSAIVLTNQILPSSSIISKAQMKGIPLLLVPLDTFEAAREIEKIEPLLLKNDETKAELVAEMVKRYVDIDKI